jgi:hypothetical protein
MGHAVVLAKQSAAMFAVPFAEVDGKTGTVLLL